MGFCFLEGIQFFVLWNLFVVFECWIFDDFFLFWV